MSKPDTPYLVSAIVSTYNAERFIAGKLEDLEAQTIADRLEIIVIDSASPQNERAVVQQFQKRYDNIRYLRTERRETVYQAWNRGIRMARGEFVTNANTDDRLRCDAYEILSNALREHPDRVLAYGDILITERENETFANHTSYGQTCFPAFDPLFLLELCCIGPFPLWRRSLHDEIGYFDERMKSAADYEFWLRAALRHPFIHLPHFVGLYWLSPETVSRKGDLPTLEYLAVQQLYRPKYAHFAPAPPSVPDQALAELERLVALGKEGGVDEALRGVERLVESYPRWARGCHDLAELYYRKNDIGPARKYFEKAAIFAPHHPPYTEKLASFMRLELHRSLQFYTAEAARNPELETSLTLAMICQLTERFEMARQHYRNALELAPDNVLAGKNLEALLLAPTPAPLPAQVSIIIPTRNALECLRECLESIRRHTPEPYQVIVVDHGSSDGSVPWLRELAAKDARFRVIEEGAGLSFAAGCNRGLDAATGEFVLFLHADTVVTADWLGGMLRHLERDRSIGVMAPMSNEAEGAQRVAAAPYRTTEEMERFADDFRQGHPGRRIPVDRLAGFCLLVPAEVVRRTGRLDQSFTGCDQASHDFCLRAVLSGRSLAIAGDVFIHHYGSFPWEGTDHPSLTRTDRKSFDAKWHLGSLEEALAKRVAARSAMTRARTLAQQGKPEEAVQLLLHQGIACSPDDPAPYRLLAELLAERGDCTGALDVLRLMPAGEELGAAVLGGVCQLRAGEGGKARALAQRALELAPQSAPALHLAALVALGDGDQCRGVELLHEAMEADPGLAAPYAALATVHRERGETRQALHLAQTAFMLAPCDMETLALYHALATAAGESAGEEARIREAIDLFPEHRGLRFALIDLMLGAGRFPEAMDGIEGAAAKFGIDEAMLEASLPVRRRLGPLAPERVPGRPTLSLCMIVKDEAKHLPNCLASVKQAVDEIVVVDTGSSDRSAEIARLFGARVTSFPWTGDFAAARNASLAQACCDWILVLDADEVLAARDLERVRELLLVPGGAAYSMVTRNYTESITKRHWHQNAGEYPAEEAGQGWTPSDKVRLFPNDARVRFKGAVHELVEDSVLALGLPVVACGVPVHHYGKLDQVKVKEKQRQYFELGMRKLAEEEGEVKPLMELAVQATELGLRGEAARLWERVLALEPRNCDAFFALGYLHLEGGDFQAGLDCSLRALELAPPLKEAAFNAAKCQLFLGATQDALCTVRFMLEHWPEYPPALALASAAHLIRGEAEGRRLVEKLRVSGYDCCDYLRDLARGLVQGGHRRQAATLLQEALSLAPDDQETREVLAACGWGGVGA